MATLITDPVIGGWLLPMRRECNNYCQNHA